MRKSEIRAELCKLNVEECDVPGGGVTPDEKNLLDREWEEYQHNSEAGSTWEEVQARI